MRKGGSVLLDVVPIRIVANGKTVETHGLLDNGSQLTLIRNDIASRLGLSGPTEHLKFTTFHGKDPNMITQRLSLSISAMGNSVSFKIPEAHSVDELYISPIRANIATLKTRWRHLSDHNLCDTDERDVTMIIRRYVRGAHDVFDLRRDKTTEDAPDGILTPFGWIAVGCTGKANTEGRGVFHIGSLKICDHDLQLHESVDRFWSTEALCTKPMNGPLLSADDRQAITLLNSSIRHLGDRYKVGLTWKDPASPLPDNRQVALRRFLLLETRFRKDPAYAKGYAKVMEEYIALGHASRVTCADGNPPGRVWYLPHHGVVNPNRPEKIRVVHGASAEFRGMSLNKALLKGPDLLVSLPGVLSRFRENRIPLSADIEKMYFQVRVPHRDRSALRFLWRIPGSLEAPATFQMNVHIFGAKSSPSTCLFILNRTAEDNKEAFGDVAKLVKSSFYVDNYLDSVNSEEEAIERCQRLSQLLA